MKWILAACWLTCASASSDWVDTPGEYVFQENISEMGWCRARQDAGECTFMTISILHNIPTCIRYLNPHVIKDGHEIPSHVDETGTPGEPGWSWSFQTDEIFYGAFEWRITVIDVCPKVAGGR